MTNIDIKLIFYLKKLLIFFLYAWVIDLLLKTLYLFRILDESTIKISTIESVHILWSLTLKES